MQKMGLSETIPAPRPKRRSKKPYPKSRDGKRGDMSPTNTRKRGTKRERDDDTTSMIDPGLASPQTVAAAAAISSLPLSPASIAAKKENDILLEEEKLPSLEDVDGYESTASSSAPPSKRLRKRSRPLSISTLSAPNSPPPLSPPHTTSPRRTKRTTSQKRYGKAASASGTPAPSTPSGLNASEPGSPKDSDLPPPSSPNLFPSYYPPPFGGKFTPKTEPDLADIPPALDDDELTDPTPAETDVVPESTPSPNQQAMPPPPAHIQHHPSYPPPYTSSAWPHPYSTPYSRPPMIPRGGKAPPFLHMHPTGGKGPFSYPPHPHSYGPPPHLYGPPLRRPPNGRFYPPGPPFAPHLPYHSRGRGIRHPHHPPHPHSHHTPNGNEEDYYYHPLSPAPQSPYPASPHDYTYRSHLPHHPLTPHTPSGHTSANALLPLTPHTPLSALPVTPTSQWQVLEEMQQQGLEQEQISQQATFLHQAIAARRGGTTTTATTTTNGTGDANGTTTTTTTSTTESTSSHDDTKTDEKTNDTDGRQLQQVYQFLGSLFDPSSSGHDEQLDSMSPKDREIVQVLMHNLATNLANPPTPDSSTGPATPSGTSLRPPITPLTSTAPATPSNGILPLSSLYPRRYGPLTPSAPFPITPRDEGPIPLSPAAVVETTTSTDTTTSTTTTSATTDTTSAQSSSTSTETSTSTSTSTSSTTAAATDSSTSPATSSSTTTSITTSSTLSTPPSLPPDYLKLRRASMGKRMPTDHILKDPHALHHPYGMVGHRRTTSPLPLGSYGFHPSHPHHPHHLYPPPHLHHPGHPPSHLTPAHLGYQPPIITHHAPHHLHPPGPGHTSHLSHPNHPPPHSHASMSYLPPPSPDGIFDYSASGLPPTSASRTHSRRSSFLLSSIRSPMHPLSPLPTSPLNETRTLATERTA